VQCVQQVCGISCYVSLLFDNIFLIANVSDFRTPIPDFGYDKPVRVCDPFIGIQSMDPLEGLIFII